MVKRFYKQAALVQTPEGYGVMLDTHTLKTPAANTIAVPHKNLAQLLAQEWAAQGDTIAPNTMPIMRLVATALDKPPAPHVQTFIDYGISDLLCYRASQPEELVAQQNAAWDPLLAWAKSDFGITLATTQGLASAPHAASTATLLAQAAGTDALRLAGLAHGSALLGSAILTLALAQAHITAQAAHEAAFLDDIFQISHWGADAEATTRLDKIALEISSLTGYFSALGS